MRDYRLYLDDILAAIEKIERYTRGKTLKQISASELLVDGIVRNLEIIGEAAKNIPVAVKNKYPEIEWKKISGLRDILIHAYFGIDIEVICDIVKNKLPVLKKQVARMRRK